MAAVARVGAQHHPALPPSSPIIARSPEVPLPAPRYNRGSADQEYESEGTHTASSSSSSETDRQSINHGRNGSSANDSSGADVAPSRDGGASLPPLIQDSTPIARRWGGRGSAAAEEEAVPIAGGGRLDQSKLDEERVLTAWTPKSRQDLVSSNQADGVILPNRPRLGLEDDDFASEFSDGDSGSSQSERSDTPLMGSVPPQAARTEGMVQATTAASSFVAENRTGITSRMNGTSGVGSFSTNSNDQVAEEGRRNPSGGQGRGGGSGAAASDRLLLASFQHQAARGAERVQRLGKIVSGLAAIGAGASASGEDASAISVQVSGSRIAQITVGYVDLDPVLLIHLLALRKPFPLMFFNEP